MQQDFHKIKRVCIYGVGGVGGYFGARIAGSFEKDRSLDREVYFIARGAHLEAIQQNGLLLKTPGGTIHSRPVEATYDFGRIPVPDLILLCTKSYDLNSAVEAIHSRTQTNTIIIPLLNGIDIYERIRSGLQNGIVLPSCVYLGTYIEKPGVVFQSGGNGIILSGRDPVYPQYSGVSIQQLFADAGIGFEWHESPYPVIWGKFIFIAAFGLVTAFSGKSLGAVAENSQLLGMVSDIMQEIAAIARQKAVELPDDIVAKSLKKAFNFPYDARTSYQRDVESWPKPNEGDLYGGAILREGRAWKVPTPVTQKVYSEILHRNGQSDTV